MGAEELNKLKKQVTESYEIISHQFQSIDSSLLAALVTLAASAGISTAFDLFVYWIPISFLLIWGVVLAVSVIAQIIRTIKTVREIFKQLSAPSVGQTPQTKNLATPISGNPPLLSSRLAQFMTYTGILNQTALFNTFAIIGLVSFSVLVTKYSDLTANHSSVNLTLPFVACFLFMSLPIITRTATSQMKKQKFSADYLSVGCSIFFVMVLFDIAYVLAYVIVPIFSLKILITAYFHNVEVPSLLLVIVLQIFTILVLINYFSAQNSKRELSKSLLSLSHIHNKIMIELDKTEHEPATVNNLQTELIEATPYLVKTDNSLFITFYSLNPNPKYLEHLKQ